MTILEYSTIGDGGRFLLDVEFGLRLGPGNSGRQRRISSGVMNTYTPPIPNAPTANNDCILITDIHCLSHRRQTLPLTGLPAHEPIDPNLVDCILAACRISTLHWERRIAYLLAINSQQVIDFSYATKIRASSL